MNYMECVRARHLNNREKLCGLANELKEKHGCEILETSGFTDDDTDILYFRVRKNGNQTIVGFAEVPYRWYIGSAARDSDCYSPCGENWYDLPFGCEEVLRRLGVL